MGRRRRARTRSQLVPANEVGPRMLDESAVNYEQGNFFFFFEFELCGILKLIFVILHDFFLGEGKKMWY